MKIYYTTRKINRLLICLSSLVLIVIAQIRPEKCTPPVQVGSPFSISHTGDVNAITGGGNLTWQIQITKALSYLAFSSCSVPAFSCISLNGYSSTIKPIQNGKYQTTTTIANVERAMDKASVEWFIDSTNRGACNLEVYDYRSTPTCRRTLKNTGTSTAPDIQVTVVCGISGVFPEPNCELFQIKSNQVYMPVPPSYVQRDTVPSGYGYSRIYSMQCTMTRPVTDLTPGVYTFQAVMYPSEVTNGRSYRTLATSSELDLTIGTPPCDHPRLTNSNDDVRITCRITSVYPKFTCKFYKRKGDEGNAVQVGSRKNSTVSCANHLGANTPSASCIHQCTLITPISSLGPGIHWFRVTMAIEGTSVNMDGLFATGIILSYPSPKIENCPTGVGVKDGYIKQGTQATCECTTPDPENPPGRVQWVHSSNNTEVGTWNEATKKTTLSLNYDPSVTDTVYHCQGVSSLGQGLTSRVDYTPKFAYGPRDIAEFATPTAINLCSSVNSISMTCYINTNTVNPKPTVVIKGLYENDNNRSLEPFSDDIQSGKYRFKFVFNPTSEGTVTARCVATNAKFGDLSTETSQVIVIREPPPSAPAMSIDGQPAIQNGQEVDVINGMPITVRCDVQGGFPSVTKVILSCMGRKFESPGTQLTQRLAPNKSNNGDMCACKAVHPSGCYTKSTQFTIKVQDSPHVTKYTLEIGSATIVVKDATQTDNSNTIHQMEVDVGTLVTFSCEGEGTPRPNMAVRNQRSQSVLVTSDMIASESKVVTTKVMTCPDTASYTCEASNGIGASRSATILILVKCPPELSTPGGEDKPFTFIKGERLVIVVSILGHPPPVNFTLSKVAPRTKRSVGGQVIDANSYDIAYLPTDELYGKVLLVLNNVTNSDEGQYQLDIQNGNGDGLQYPFFIQGNEENTSTSSSNIGAIVGCVVAGLAVIAIISVIIICLHRKGKGDKENASIYVYNNDCIDNTFIHQETTFGHVRSDPGDYTDPRPIPYAYEDVDTLTRQDQYEEVNIATPSTEYLELEPEQPYANEEDTDNPATEYANLDEDGQVRSSDQPKNIYDKLEEDQYYTPD